MLRQGPGAAAVEVELPAAPKTRALGSVSVPVGALESKLAGSCVSPGSVSPVASRQFAGGLSF